MNKSLVLYSNYTKFEFEMIDEECIVENNRMSVSDTLDYARKLSSPYNILRGDIFTIAHVAMADGKIKDVYTLLKSLKLKEDKKKSLDEMLESQDFYDLMQEYRHLPISVGIRAQLKVSQSFENIKKFIKEYAQ